MNSTALTIVHKFIRRELFEVALRLSTAGPTDGPAIAAAVDALAQILRGHASHEEALLEPMLARVDAALAAKLREEHAEHEQHLERICAAAAAAGQSAVWSEGDRLALYLQVNRFLAAYLPHLDDEECRLVPAVGEGQLPVEQVARSAGAQPPEARRAFLERLWTVVAPHEREAIERALPR